ncbi:MAG: DUF563 domain-containing protein, partial [Cyanobacteria bacterium J083]
MIRQAEKYYQQGCSLQREGYWQLAINAYATAIALNSDCVAAYYNLGVIYAQRGEIDKSLAMYRRVIERQPENLAAYNNLASLLVQLNRLDEASAIYQQAVNFAPDSAILYNNLAQVFFQQNEFAQALEAFRQAIELHPTMSQAHHNLGLFWLQQRNYAAAVQSFLTVIELEPTRKIYTDCAVALIAQNEWQAAMDYLRLAIENQSLFLQKFCHQAKQLSPSNSLNCAKLACAKFLQGLQAKDAITQLCLYLAEVYYHLGNSLSAYGSIHSAQWQYEKALQLNPNFSELYLRLGNTLVKQDRQAAALAIYHLGLLVAPEDAGIHYHLGKLLEQNKQPEEAIKHYEEVIEQQNKFKQNLPKIYQFKSVNHLNQLQGIYPRAQDWVVNCRSKGSKFQFNYQEVDWLVDSTPPQSFSPSQALAPPSRYQANLDCGGVTCSACMSQLIKSFQPLQLEPGVYFISNKYLPKIPFHPTFSLTMTQARAWVAPQLNDWQICHSIALITPDNYLLADLSRHYPWYLPGCQKHNLTQHQFFQLEALPPLTQIPGRVAMMSTLSGHVYYHWMIDLLPRFEILRRSGKDLEQIDWFVVNSQIQPFQAETLQCLGIPPEKILSSDEYPYIQAEEMIIPSFPGHLDWVAAPTIAYLRQLFLLPQSRQLFKPSRIYVTRQGAKYRQIINSQELEALLSYYGFVTICLENYSVKEQASLFAAAEVIVAAHGGALTNTVFCQPETTIIEIFSPNYLRSDYWMISQLNSLRHYYI